MSFLLVEVEPDIKVHVAEEVVCRELLFTIVVAIQDAADTGEPFRVIPDDSEPACSVKNNILKREVPKNGAFVFSQVTSRMFVTYGH